MNERTNKILRWIFFLPIAIVAVVVTGLVWGIFSNIAMLRIARGIETWDYITYVLITFPMSGFLSGYVFVYAGSVIAPTDKKWVSVMLYVIALIFAVIGIVALFFIETELSLYESLAFSPFMIIGAVSAYNTLKEEN